ncbi:hypothetical protein AKO1_001179 [Acrasis kona]|uniref:Uncharacterized protein n=1 Tax=Acrasis kona TaxID=1008807 RepID=A0AAW2ZCB5_9EUKA
MPTANEDEDHHMTDNGSTTKLNVAANKQKKKGGGDEMDTTQDDKSKEASDLDSALLIETKLKQTRDEILEVQNGKNAELLKKIEDFKKIKMVRIKVSERYRDMQIEAANNVFSSEKQQAINDCQNDINMFQEQFLNNLIDKERRLKEKSLEDPSTDKGGRTLRKRTKESDSLSSANQPNLTQRDLKNAMTYENYTKKKRLPANKELEFVLSKDEINDDLTQINRTRTGTGKKHNS